MPDTVVANKHTYVTLLASGARTASANSGDQVNNYAVGIQAVIDITALNLPTTTTAAPGTTTTTPAPPSWSLTLKIEGKDPTSGKYYTILSSAALSTTGTTVLTVYPGIAAASNVSASSVLPRVWRATVTASTTDSLTYSVGAHLLG